jgi:hypothetical protein
MGIGQPAPVTGRPPRRARRTVPSRTRPSLSAAVLLVATGLLACGRSDGATPKPVAPGRGTVLAPAEDPLAAERAEAPLLGAMIDPAGTTLTLYALAPGRAPLAAGELAAAVARSDGAAVHVLVRRPEGGGTAAPASEPALCRIEHELHVLELALPGPLAGRPLVDDATGAVIAPMGREAVLRPAALPEGWRRLDERPLREGGAQVGWAQRYGGSDAGPTVSLTQRLAALGPLDRYQSNRTAVTVVPLRGTTATFSRQANWAATGLTWTEGGWTVGLDSSSPDGRQPPVDQAGLEAFAASLQVERRPG